MNRIIDFCNRIRKKGVPGLVWVLTACLVFVVGVIIFMPSAKAVELTTTEWTGTDNGDGTHTYKLSDLAGKSNAIAEISVQAGATYIIDGSGTTEGSPLTDVFIKFKYSAAEGSENVAVNVNVVLDNVHMKRTVDAAMLSYATTSSAAQYNVTVKGDCTMTSDVSGASLTPVMGVEDIQFDLLELKHSSKANATIDDFIVHDNTIREVTVNIGGENTESTLSINVLDDAAYGAVIGSSEAKKLQDELTQTSEELVALKNQMNNAVQGQTLVTINDTAILDIVVNQYKFVPETGYKNKFRPQFRVGTSQATGAGMIIIGGENGEAPLRLNISTNGYGAAIGGGAGTEAAGTSANARDIVINAGTVEITSTRSGVTTIGTGVSLKAESTPGTVSRIEINGGSIKLNTAGSDFSVHPVNYNDKKVYLVKGDTAQNATEKITALASLSTGTKVPLEYIYETGLTFSADLSSENVTTSLVAAPGTVNIVDVKISLLEDYYYKGTGHGEDMLYFYLPATESTLLTLSDEFGPGSGDEYASYLVYLDGSTTPLEPMITNDPTSEGSRSYILVRDKTYYIVATPPKYLELQGAILNRGGNDEVGKYVPGKGYEVEATTGSIDVTFAYGGIIDIVYDLGISANDNQSHNTTGVAPTADYNITGKDIAGYEEGQGIFKIPVIQTIFKDKAKNVKDLIFVKWQYVLENGTRGDINYITKDKTSGADASAVYMPYTSLMWSDGKIHLEAVWNIEISYVLDDGASMTRVPDTITLPYGSNKDTNYTTNITLPSEVPVKNGYLFLHWSLDDGTKLESTAPVQLSTFTSHKISSNFNRDGFRVYIDANGLDPKYSDFICVSASNGSELLELDGDGARKLTVVDGVKYYRTTELHKGDQVMILVSTETGYLIKTITIEADDTKCGTDIGSVEKDIDTGDYYVDFVMDMEDVYVAIEATFEAIEYEVNFMDGKSPNEALWENNSFWYTVEDIDNRTTIGDIIRRGLGKSKEQMSDPEISEYVNNIDKNDKNATFEGWKNPLLSGIYGSGLTLKDMFEQNQNIGYGSLTFTASWREAGKVRLNLSILERNFLADGTHEDKDSERYTGILYYLEGENKVPVYTQTEIDPETGEELEIAYASPGETLHIDVYEMDENGEPVGEPVTKKLDIAQLYYWYYSIRGEDGYINVHNAPLTYFNVEDESEDGTIIDVYLVYSVRKYKIIYWDLHGFDNSMNPTEFTVYDEFDFVPIVEGVDWLLVCPDTDDTNFDDVKTEVITGVSLGGKPVTDGTAGDRDYVSNLVLIPDWGDYIKDEYTITIIVDGEEYGEVTIAHPSNATSYMADQLILLSVLAEEGYELVPESLVYRKDNSRAAYSLSRGRTLMTREVDTFPVQEVDAEKGTYLFTMPESDVIVYATFKLREYNIIYEDITEEMVNPNPDKYNVKSDITLVDVEKNGYTFVGWYDVDGNKVENIVDRTGDIVLIPRFEPISDEIEPPSDEIDPPGSVIQKPIDIVGRPSNVTINSSTYKPVQTGDQTNVPRLILICVAAVLILLIVIIKKPRDKDEDEETTDTDVANHSEK